ncbi:MAG TPA: hypothetical protein VN944_08515, partial [Nitrospiria bacterium]|nr:hypothetical protein [Nitrospiria bacterium]
MIQTGKQNNKTLKRLFQVLAPYRKTIFLAALLFALVAAVNLAILWNVRGLVDKTMVHRDMSAISATIRVLLSL